MKEGCEDIVDEYCERKDEEIAARGIMPDKERVKDYYRAMEESMM